MLVGRCGGQLSGGRRLILGLVLCLVLALRSEFGIQDILMPVFFKISKSAQGSAKASVVRAERVSNPPWARAGTQIPGPCPSL